MKIDVVVVSYNSRAELRRCVLPLVEHPRVHVIVVDNASRDDSLGAIADLPVDRVALDTNHGFAHGCNVGWRLCTGEYVLFLNPDALIESEDLDRLAAVLDSQPDIGCVGPRIADVDGSLQFSIRRFPRLSSHFAKAFFVHRLFPRAPWADEVQRDEALYASSGPVEWLSGACLLVRRSQLELLDGLDEGFFMYFEDVDLCRRLRKAGSLVWYESGATCVHEGGCSAPRPGLLPVLATSRLRYGRKHFGRFTRVADRVGIATLSATHVLVARGGRDIRAGHARSLGVAVGRRQTRSVRPST